MPLRFIAINSPLAFLTVLHAMELRQSRSDLASCFDCSEEPVAAPPMWNVRMRQLRARFADGLCGDDTHRFAAFDQPAGCEVTTVAELANAALRFAGEHRADLHAFDTSSLDRSREFFADDFVNRDDGLAFVIDLIFESHTTHDAVAQRLDDFTRFDDRLDVDAVAGSAIFFGDDHVLRHVAEAAGQVAGVGRFERGIGQALTSAVRRDEVLQNVQTLAEVRGDRLFDDFAGRAKPSDRAYRTAGGSVVSNRGRRSRP